jgi:hypothetical protein
MVTLILNFTEGTSRYASAVSIFQVSIDTATLSGTAATLAFNLIDGDGVSNNVVSITNFATNGTLGAAVADPPGAVTGALPGSTTLSDPVFFNALMQEITLDTTLTFTLALTESFAGGPLPDALAVFLLDAAGLASLVSTTDPTGADALFAVDITGAAFGALQTFTPMASVTAIPEPSALLLLLTGLAGLLAYRRQHDGAR